MSLRAGCRALGLPRCSFGGLLNSPLSFSTQHCVLASSTRSCIAAHCHTWRHVAAHEQIAEVYLEKFRAVTISYLHNIASN